MRTRRRPGERPTEDAIVGHPAPPPETQVKFPSDAFVAVRRQVGRKWDFFKRVHFTQITPSYRLKCKKTVFAHMLFVFRRT